MKNILFITWDGPETTYMEGLFLPIFSKIQDSHIFSTHVIQFSWSSDEKLAVIEEKANELNIKYTSKAIYRKPNALFGSVISLVKGINFLKKYIEENNIEIVIPRSTMPAIMVNYIKKINFKILFDADGLPLEERVDFSELSKRSLQYKFLKNQESKMLVKADGVLTRSKKAINIHLESIGCSDSRKFSVVINGRDENFFKSDLIARAEVRKMINASSDTKVFVYCGSLGLQYGWDEMISIFNQFHQKNRNSKFLILTGNVSYAKKRIPFELKDHILVKNVPFDEVPSYLSAADVAFAIREPSYSMKGVAPIKLGEYLLMGIPTIASKGIGDSQEIIEKISGSFLYNHHSSERFVKAIEFIENSEIYDQKMIRSFGINFFSLEKSALSYFNSLNLLV